jgi:hypothetical protein
VSSYQREWTKKSSPDGLDLYEHAAWLKKQRLAGEAWGRIQEEAAGRRRVEEERLLWMERNANQLEPEPEPVTKQARWKKVAAGAVSQGTLTGVLAAAAAAKREQSRRLAWGIKASDRYRLATVLREERPKWEKHKRVRAAYQLRVNTNSSSKFPTVLQTAYHQYPSLPRAMGRRCCSCVCVCGPCILLEQVSEGFARGQESCGRNKDPGVLPGVG